MISKELFVKMMKFAEKFESEINRWNDFGIELFELPIGTIPWEMFNVWCESYFDEEGQDWISWYLWERKSIFNGEVMPCYDEQGIQFYVNSAEELWPLVSSHRLSLCSRKSESCTN